MKERKGNADEGRGDIKRLNKGDGREWIGMKICAGERGDKEREIKKDVRGIKRMKKGDGREWKGMKMCAWEWRDKGRGKGDVREA